MSISVMGTVWEQSQSTGNNRLLMLAIADNASDDGFAWPGYRYLIKKVNVVRETLRRCIEAQEAAGELYVNREQRKSRYLVLVGQTDDSILKALTTRFKMARSAALAILELIQQKRAGWSATKVKQQRTNRSRFKTNLERSSDKTDERSKNKTSDGLEDRPEPSFNHQSNHHESSRARESAPEDGAMKADGDCAQVFTDYEANIAMITPMIRDKIVAALDDGIPAAWMSEAIQLAVENNKRSWSYAYAILERWQREGKDNGKPDRQPQPTTGRSGKARHDARVGQPTRTDREPPEAIARYLAAIERRRPDEATTLSNLRRKVQARRARENGNGGTGGPPRVPDVRGDGGAGPQRTDQSS